MSRYLPLTALRPVWRMSVAHGDDFPICHGLQAVKMDLNGGAFRTGWDEEISDGGKDRDEALQTSW